MGVTSTPSDPLAPSFAKGGLNALLAEFSDLWGLGLEPRAEDYLGRIDGDDRAAQVELVYHEFGLAEADGQRPDPGDYLRRFPSLAGPLARVLGVHQALSGSLPGGARRATWEPPEPGDRIGPYQLLRELGRGGLARVFLAEQSDLDDRLVVLKVSARPSREAGLLARARHPHIVEVLRQGASADGAMHLIAMPFSGGATLADVLPRVQPSPGRTGRDLLRALDRAAAPEYRALGAAGAFRDLIAGGTYAQAMAWVVARLAEALGHAERQGVTHGDLKPANVLLAADGRPMLLDFNLAADWTLCDPADPGGTLAYMAPERLRAVADPRDAAPPRRLDRHRADVYALGLLLRECLTARSPVVPPADGADPRAVALALADARERAPSRAWTIARGVPIGLRPVLARCLAADPADRYARSADLARDLDLWRAGGLPEHAGSVAPALIALVAWVRRRRGALLAGLGVAVVATALAGASAWRSQTSLRAAAEERLASWMDSDDPSVFRSRRFGQWRGEFREDVVRSSTRHLRRYRVLDRDDWRDQDDVALLGEDDRLDLESWLLEQSWRLASALGNRPDAPADWRQALSILGRDPIWSRLAPFEARRRALRQKLGLPEPPPTPPRGASAPAWLERYADGLAAEPSGAAATLASYRAALELRPGRSGRG